VVPANAKQTATATSVSNALLNPNSVAAKLAQATTFGGVTSAASRQQQAMATMHLQVDVTISNM
jgi:hypothetical protein